MQLPSLSRLLIFSSVCAVSHLGAVGVKKEDKKEIKAMTTETTSKTAASPKIAIVNVHRIITVDPKALPNASDEWRSLYSKLQDTLKPANSEIEELEGKYKKKIAEIEGLQKSGVSSKEKHCKKNTVKK